MIDAGLNSLIERWAQWSSKGRTLASSNSILASLMNSQSGGGKGLCDDSEQLIDDIITALAKSERKKHQQWAQLIILHYSVLPSCLNLNNKQKAYQLNCTETTYYNRLKAAHCYISHEYYK